MMEVKVQGLRRCAKYLINHKMLNWLPDSLYLQIYYYWMFGKLLKIKNAKTYNEKLNWLKLNYRVPELSLLVDKYEVKKYVASKIGEEYIIPTFGVWDRFEDIDFSKLPNQFVLKCTHDSGGVVICKDKKELQLNIAREKINKSLGNNYYLWAREWPYKNIKPRIIAEEYKEDFEKAELRDYKFFCFSGEPKLMFIASGRQEKKITFDFFDMEFQHLDIKQHYPNASFIPEKPKGFKKMIELAKKISEGFPHVRVDFYEVDNQIFFGEITFYHFAGLTPFETEEWDEILGQWITLPIKSIR